MKIPIVNEKDEVICYKDREETTREDIRRIVSLCVFNEKGEVLIAKRQKDKKIDPDVQGPSVAGTVDEGYDYDDTVVKEAEEEIGLKDIQPIFLNKYYYETINARRWSSRYYLQINSKERELHKQESEVSELKWISIEDLEKWVKERPQDFVPNFPKGSLVNIKESFKKLNFKDENQN